MPGSKDQVDRGDTELGDVEKGKVQKKKNPKRGVDMSGDVSTLKSISPKSSPGNSSTSKGGDPFTVQVNQQRRSRGLLGMTMGKSALLCGTGLCLAGGLAYFVMEWFEIPGLNAQIDRLEGEVDKLSAENDRFGQLNNELNATVTVLQNITDDLNQTAIRLEDTNQELSSRIITLEEQNQFFVEQNEQLSGTIDDLATIATYLNDTALSGLDNSLEQISGLLANQIIANQEIVLRSLEYTLIQRVDNWNCDYNTVYSEKPYVEDYNAVIPESDFDQIMAYLGNLVLDELCLSLDDFKRYLEQPMYSPLTSIKLVSAMKLYTTEALDWYFPERNESGLTHEQWSEASFECKNLDPTIEYKFS
ncbi:unnamed protein product [Cylindrotheca closterium]|uniref:Uncharacterized protein n=1 Tax=Cylindrotheca closterium TaxID=2856 RepID=A0AAD2GAX2_9STRA|nr:unnamed protein product [Cylindrotheca closterium]